MVTGQDENRRDAAVIIELKQWDHCDVLHPSARDGQYQSYLEDSHTAFYEALGDLPPLVSSRFGN